jgi:hypothetical protein
MWPGWLTDALRGKVSLSRAFWLYGLGLSVLYSVPGFFIDIENRPLVAIYLIGGLALGVLQTIILWRSAANARSRALGRLVHAAIVAGLILALLMVYVLYKNRGLLPVS